MSAFLISKGIMIVESPCPKTKRVNMSHSHWPVNPCRLCLLPTEAVGRKRGHHKGNASVVCVDVVSSYYYYYPHYAKKDTVKWTDQDYSTASGKPCLAHKLPACKYYIIPSIK